MSVRILPLAPLAVLAALLPGPLAAQGQAAGEAQSPNAPAASPAPAPPVFTPGQQREIVGILREALRDDPSILRDAVAALQEADRQEQASGQRAAIAAHRDALFHDAADPVRGNPRGAVTLVAFFDPRCGYCKRLHPVLGDLLRRNPDVRLVMKELPVLGPSSVQASRALLAAQRQGRYFELEAALMQLREEPTEPVLRREAERAGLDWARLKRDMGEAALGQRLQESLRLASALRIEGTPALVVGETLIPGAVDLETLEGFVATARGTAPG